MEKTEILKTLSDVLGFDCSDFGEVMENGILDKGYDTKEEAEVACKKIRALAELLNYSDKDFKVYYDGNYCCAYVVATDKEMERLPADSRPVLVA